MFEGGGMPTGSGGGHFSGSGSSGGGHFGGDNNMNYGGARRRGIRFGRPVFIYTFGSHNYYIGEKRASLLMTLTFFLFLSIVILVSNIGNYFEIKDKIQIIENDYINYTAIIEDAEQDSSKIVLGTFQGKEFKYGKWCIKYKFTYNEQEYQGYSFYVYSISEVNQMANQGGVQIAVGNSNALGEPDSIEMSFKNKTLTDDGEYNHCISDLNGSKMTVIIFGVIVGALLVCVVTISAISFKKDMQKEESQEQTVSNVGGAKYCSYCGSKMKEGEVSCPYCGAKENSFENRDA